MNIFRVLASGKQTFREEFISAFLAYLLSPKMDHGLGSKVLSTLLSEVGKSLDSADLLELSEQFGDKLRSDLFAEEASVSIELEVNTGKDGVIDVVLNYDEWYILIENKIYLQSVRPDQIANEYRGLKRLLNERGVETSRIVVIYLVPAMPGPDDNWFCSETTREELDFELDAGDLAALVTWQPTEEPSEISVVGILRQLLRDEAEGKIAPISYDVRQLLLSFIDFSLGEFKGYPYERAVAAREGVPKSTVAEILRMDGKLFVGIRGGMAGIMRKAWRTPGFMSEEYPVTDDENRGWQYLPLNEFQTLARWAMGPDNNTLSGIEWRGKPFWTDNLYHVAKAAGDDIYVGVRGGRHALEQMSKTEIEERKAWEIDTQKRSGHWFTGTEFCEVLESKGIQYQ